MCVNIITILKANIYFTIMLITYILPRRNSFYELVAEITNNFIEHRKVAYALIDILVLLSKYRVELQLPQPCVIDNNFRRIFTEPEAIYQGEFNRYMHPSNYDTDDTDSEAEIENFNEYYLKMAPKLIFEKSNFGKQFRLFNIFNIFLYE